MSHDFHFPGKAPSEDPEAMRALSKFSANNPNKMNLVIEYVFKIASWQMRL
jgi:hypothetical protein